MTLVLLIPTLHCLLVCTHKLFRRSLGICSMTYSLFLLLCGGVSMPFLQPLSGRSLFVDFQVVLWMPWSAAVWGEVGRCGRVDCRPTLDNYCRSCLGLVFYLGI